MITADRIREAFDYDPLTGVLVWKISSGCCKPGDLAGRTPDRKGYLWVFLDGKKRPAHFYAWSHYHGFLPEDQVDHRDLDKSNNRISNLREADTSKNKANVPAPKSNKSGFKGVCWDKQHRKWRSKICVNYKQIFLGIFHSKEEAARAYDAAAIKHFGEFARINLP